MPGFQHAGLDIYQRHGIWMTGDPSADHEDCCGSEHQWPCAGVMIEAHFGSHPTVWFCRYHLDLFANMIIHTRQLREADSAEGS